jgi:hypothetical protein
MSHTVYSPHLHQLPATAVYGTACGSRFTAADTVPTLHHHQLCGQPKLHWTPAQCPPPCRHRVLSAIDILQFPLTGFGWFAGLFSTCNCFWLAAPPRILERIEFIFSGVGGRVGLAAGAAVGLAAESECADAMDPPAPPPQAVPNTQLYPLQQPLARVHR